VVPVVLLLLEQEQQNIQAEMALLEHGLQVLVAGAARLELMVLAIMARQAQAERVMLVGAARPPPVLLEAQTDQPVLNGPLTV
jgi:hypothetical protein